MTWMKCTTCIKRTKGYEIQIKGNEMNEMKQNQMNMAEHDAINKTKTKQNGRKWSNDWVNEWVNQWMNELVLGWATHSLS